MMEGKSRGISDIVTHCHRSLCNSWYVSGIRESFQQVCTFLVSLVDCRAKQMITNRRNRLGTDSVECVECLHHWLGSEMVEGVSMEWSEEESMVVNE